MSTASAPDAPRALPDPSQMLAALHQALMLMPDNIDAMVALTGLYLRTGRLDKASHWVAQALARQPDHKSALKLRKAIGDSYVETGMRVVISGDTTTAIDVFARAAELGNAEARSYLALFRQAEAWFAAAATLPREAGSSRLSLAVWGESYAREAANLFRSLLAPGNIPALAARGKVRLEIATSARERAILDALPSLRALRAHAEIDYFTLDDEILNYDRARLPAFQYWIMAAVHYASVRRAHHAGSHLSFLTADCIFADGSFAAARRHVDAGKTAVMFAGLEVDRDSFLAAIGDHGDSVLALPARDMVHHALAHLHPHMLALIHEPGRTVSVPIPHPMMFRIDGGLVQRGFHVGPLMMSADILARDFAPDFLTCDTRLMRLALGRDDPEGRIKVVDDSDEIAAVSMSRQMPTALETAPFDAQRLGKWASRWCFSPEDVPYFEWCFRQRRALRGRDAAPEVPPPDAQEIATVEAVLSQFRRSAVERVKTL